MNDTSKSRRTRTGASRPAEILAGDSTLSGVREHAIELRRAKALLWPHLPPELRPHCDLANLRGTTLVFVARSPVWAARLRHESPEILHAATRVCKMAVQRIQVRVDPGGITPPAQPRPKTLSATSAEHLRRTADDVDDEAIAASLRKIASRGKSDD